MVQAADEHRGVAKSTSSSADATNYLDRPGGAIDEREEVRDERHQPRLDQADTPADARSRRL